MRKVVYALLASIVIAGCQPIGSASRSGVAFYNTDGDVVYVSKERYFRTVLSGEIEKAWNDPDELYSLIVSGLHDDLQAYCIKPSRHLVDIDSGSLRSMEVLAISLLGANQLDEAQSTLEQAIAKHGENASLLTNLAKVYAERGDQATTEKTLRKALHVDPNLLNALKWWNTIHVERGGEGALQAALLEIQEEPGAWRPKLYLAGIDLKESRFEDAMKKYREVLPIAADGTEVLATISGDLGSAGYPREAVDLVGPHYNPQRHDTSTGINLVSAHIALSEFDEAEALLNQLEQRRRYDFKKLFNRLREQIEKKRNR